MQACRDFVESNNPVGSAPQSTTASKNAGGGGGGGGGVGPVPLIIPESQPGLLRCVHAFFK